MNKPLPTGYLYGAAKMFDTYRDQLVGFIGQVNKLPQDLPADKHDAVHKLMHDIAMADSLKELDEYIRNLDQLLYDIEEA